MADAIDPTERSAAAIAASVKQARKPTPRWLWILAAVVGTGCAVAFVVAMLVPPDPGGPTTQVSAAAQTGRGFGAGIVVGLVAGVAVGLAVGRSRAQRDGRA